MKRFSLALIGASLILPELARAQPAPGPADLPTIRTPTPAENAATLEMFKAQDAELAQILGDPNRKRWTALPQYIESAWTNGPRTLFHSRDGVPGFNAELYAKYVHELWAGQTQFLRIWPLLVDHQGRIWVSKAIGIVSRYDGEKWTDFDTGFRRTPAPPVARGPTSGPSTRPRINRGPRTNNLLSSGFEDSAGNAWFVIGGEISSAWKMIRVRPDDLVEQFPLTGDIDSSHYDPSYPPKLMEQDDGAIVFSALIGKARDDPNVSSRSCYIARWNGHEWQNIVPHCCDHLISSVMPQKNGSVKFICDGGRVWTWWPKDRLNVASRMARNFFRDLSDPDAEKRDAAMRGLLTLGPQISTLMPPEGDANALPEVQVRMQFVRDNYQEMAKVDEKGRHTSLASIDVGIELGIVSPVARTQNRGVVLYAKPAKDKGQDNPYPQALVWMDEDGRCTVKPVPPNQFNDPAPGTRAEDGFADATGAVWKTYHVRDDAEGGQVSYRYDRQGNHQRAAPPGFSVDRVLGEDAAGRVYLEARFRLVMFDEKLPADRTWKLQTFTGSGVASLPGARVGWSSIPSRDSTPRIKYLSEFGAGTIALPSDLRGDFKLTPLRGNAAIVQDRAEGSIGYVTPGAAFYDGKSWKRDQDVISLIKTNAREIAPLAGQFMENPIEKAQIAAPRTDRGQLWLAGSWRGQGGGPNRVPPTGSRREIQFFDGANWHDVLAELTKADPDGNGTVDGTTDDGKVLLVENFAKRKLFRVSWDGQAIKVKVEQTERPLLLLATDVRDPSGGLWFRGGSETSPARLVMADRIESARSPGEPVFCDSKQRVWFIDLPARLLRVKVRDKWFQGPVTMLERGAKIVEGPDGRIWLAQFSALSLIELTEGDAPAIREIHRWLWDAPKENLDGAFIDAKNGLFLDGQGQLVARYELPSP